MTEQPTIEPRTTYGRRQIAIIGGVVAAAAALGIALGVVLTGGGRGASLAAAAQYVPSDAVMYIEARLDLPGDQRANLRGIIERFPGADADAVLTDALADTLDTLLDEAGMPVDYSTDVASWFDGTVAMAVLEYPASADPTAMAMEMPSTLIAFGSRDPEGASALADQLRGEMELAGVSFTSTDHGGVTIWSMDLDADMAYAVPMSGLGFAYAVTDDQLLLSNGEETMVAALDAHEGSGGTFASRDGLAALVARLPAERAGMAAIDIQAMLSATLAQLEQQAPDLAEVMNGYLADEASLVVSSISFEADAVRFDGASANATGDLAQSNGRRDLASHVPADAFVFGDGSNVGESLSRAVVAFKASYAAMPDGMGVPDLDQVEDALGADFEEFVAWIDDGAFAAGWSGGEPYGGLVLEAPDADLARQRLDQLRALARLAAFGGSSGLQVSTEDVDGVEVTTIAFESGDAMMPAPGGVIEYAVDGDVALLGIGESFVRRVIALDEADSLAQTDRFTTAVERYGGFDNVGTLYLDLAALRDTVGEAMGASFAGDVREYLEPLDYLVSVSRVEGDEMVSRGALVLR
jgi:hypothetical protein